MRRYHTTMSWEATEKFLLALSDDEVVAVVEAMKELPSSMVISGFWMIREEGGRKFVKLKWIKKTHDCGIPNEE